MGATVHVLLVHVRMCIAVLHQVPGVLTVGFCSLENVLYTRYTPFLSAYPYFENSTYMYMYMYLVGTWLVSNVNGEINLLGFVNKVNGILILHVDLS